MPLHGIIIMDKTPEEVGKMFTDMAIAETRRQHAAIEAMAIEAGMLGYPRPADYDPEAAAQAGGYTHAEIKAMVAACKEEDDESDAD